MGRFLIKCDPNVDLYLEWSTVVDAPVGVGTREQMENRMNTPVRDEVFMTKQAIESRLQRTDVTGSSYLDGSMGGWNDSGLILHNVYPGAVFLPRRNFLAYAKLLLQDINARPDGLTEPLEDDANEEDQ